MVKRKEKRTVFLSHRRHGTLVTGYKHPSLKAEVEGREDEFEPGTMTFC